MGPVESRVRAVLDLPLTTVTNPDNKPSDKAPATLNQPSQATTVLLPFLQTFSQVCSLSKDHFDTTMYPSLAEALRDVLADTIELVQTNAVKNHEVPKLVNYLVSFVKGLDSPDWVEVDSGDGAGVTDSTNNHDNTAIEPVAKSTNADFASPASILLAIVTEILQTNFTVANRNRPVTLFLLDLAVALGIDLVATGLEAKLAQAYVKSLVPVKSIIDKGVCQQCYYDDFHRFCQRNQIPLATNYLVWFLKTRWYSGFLSHVKLTAQQKTELLELLPQFSAKVGAEIIELCL